MALTYLFQNQRLGRKARYFENFKEETSIQSYMNAKKPQELGWDGTTTFAVSDKGRHMFQMSKYV